MRTTFKSTAGLALVLCFLSSAITIPEAFAGKEVGYVERLSGGPSKYAILRDGELLDVGLFTPVLVDDQVILEGENLELVVRYGASERVVITNAESPYTISDTSNPTTVTGNVARWLKKLVTPWHEEEVLS